MYGRFTHLKNFRKLPSSQVVRALFFMLARFELSAFRITFLSLSRQLFLYRFERECQGNSFEVIHVDYLCCRLITQK